MTLQRRQFVSALAGAVLAPAVFGIDGVAAAARLVAGTDASVVDRPSNATVNRHYPSNRAPLQHEFFVKLPVGSVRPGGWLRRQLELQRDGLTGHLGEISIWLTRHDNAWLAADGKGKYGWEELPYWLKGYANIGYVLDDPAMIREARFWIEAVLANQRESGDFGPEVFKKGSRDLWTNMPMLFCLQSWHEHSGDPRVLDLMTRYFRWQLSLPDDHFLEDYWENSRGGDNLYSVHWLYNRTREPWLLELAEKLHRNTADWGRDGDLPNWHNVNIAQCFREPATWSLQSHDPADREATYADFALVRERYGQVPGGMFGADENAREGYDDPRQAIETCGMVEQMTSNALLLRFTGDARWAENTEDVAFNMFPAAFTPDYRALRYLTAPNMTVSDGRDHHPGIDNGGPFLMMNPFSSRCCQHNHAAGWVYYSENAWSATPDDGLAAQLYHEGEVTARVGEDGVPVTIASSTRYPFEEEVRLSVRAPREAAFPLYLRVPSWSRGATVRVNGEAVPVEARPGAYVRLARTWRAGDAVTLSLPMALRVRRWARNKGSASVDYGPLTFSLDVEERYVRRDSRATAQHDARWQPGADASRWPAFEIYPDSPWNYGLVLDDEDPARSLRVVRRAWPADDQPFTQAHAPLEIRARGRRIPGWRIDEYGLTGVLPPSPVATTEPVEELRLVPMGGARLRISAFPTVL